MKSKKEYRIAEYCNSDPLEAICELGNVVEDYLSKGWVLQGGVAITYLPNGNKFADEEYYIAAQAVIREVNVYGCGRITAEDFMLEKGKALVIMGEQGSGKTALARELAELHGGGCFVTSLDNVTTKKPVLVVEEVIELDEDKINAVLTAQNAPFLILCMQGDTQPSISPENRRMSFIRI